MSTPPPSEPAATRRPALGLRGRLMLWLGVPLLAILVGSSVVDYVAARQITDRTLDQALADSLFDIEAHLHAIREAEPLELDEEAGAMLRSNAPDTLFYAARDAAGRALIGDDDLPARTGGAEPGVPQFSDASFRGQPVRVAALRTQVRGQSLDLVVAQTTVRRREVQRTLLAAMLWPNVSVVVLTLLAVGFGVRRGLRPLTAVEQEIAHRTASDLRPFDLRPVPGEIRPMLQRLNELFDMVRQASHQQQRFIADAAHQLRTPLAALRNQVDLALQAGRRAPDEVWLGKVDEATGRMNHLLDRLLAHARAEATEAGDPAAAPVLLDHLAEEAATDFLDAALERDIDLGFDLAPAAVRGSRWMLKEALANLVDNAIRYTPRGGIVTVRCGHEQRCAYLEVQDNGPGIAPEQHERALQRFHRLPGSPGDGCGLGLTIVQEIARRHGASLQLHSADGGGLRARLLFPAA